MIFNSKLYNYKMVFCSNSSSTWLYYRAILFDIKILMDDIETYESFEYVICLINLHFFTLWFINKLIFNLTC